MPHGFGEVAKGAAQVAGYAGRQLGNVVGSTYNSGMDFIGSYGKTYMQNLKNERDLIANPAITGKYGGKLQSGFNDSFRKRQGNLFTHYAKDHGKGFLIGGALTTGMYGLGAWATDNPDNSAGDRMANVAKYGVAAGVDTIADLGLSIAATGLSMLGPAGVIAGGALQAFNIGAGLFGVDAGSLAMNIMNYADEEYDRVKQGPKFNMTQGTSMAMQRQIQNLHASGSNLGEIMHN